MKNIVPFLVLAITFALADARAQAQRAEVVGKLGYPELILYNAKIVTIDDPGVNENLGRIVQAMAIRDGRILATGTDAEIRALSGPHTREINLRGREVLPGFIMCHEHPNDWMWEAPTAWEHALPMENGRYLIHWLAPGTADEQYRHFWSTLKEMVDKAKPGQWIVLEFDRASNLAYGEDTMKFFRGQKAAITMAGLDNIAPNNPVMIRSGAPQAIINRQAVEDLDKQVPGGLKNFAPSGNIPLGMYPNGIQRWEEKPTGIVSRGTFPEGVFNGNYRMIAKLLKASLQLWAAYGITTFASNPYNPVTFQAFGYLDRTGEMPDRYAWAYGGPDYSVETLRTVAGLLGQGTDHMWNIGAWGAAGGSCTTIPAPPAIKDKERCSFAPGSVGRRVLDRIIETGGRVATMHTGGDKDIDYYLDAIEEDSRKAGLSLADIRAKRQTFDHLDGAPRPEQIARIKKLGMIVGGQNWFLNSVVEPGTYNYVRRYGEKYTCWVVPRKSLFDAGIKTGFEVDKPVPWKLFQRVYDGMTRYNRRDKKVYCPSERTDRIVQLKAMTTWGSYYVLREKDLGSLEPGKLADFVVVDKDFLTVPAQEIPNIHVLMTVVGGKTIHLMPSLANAIHMSPVGPVTWKGIKTPYLGEAAKELYKTGQLAGN